MQRVYYFATYFNLFVSVDSWATFAVFQLLKIASEVASFATRFSATFQRLGAAWLPCGPVRAWLDIASPLESPAASDHAGSAAIIVVPSDAEPAVSLHQHASHADAVDEMRARIAQKYVLHFLAENACLVCFVAMLTIVHCGPNAPFFPLLSALSHDDYARVCIFACVALAVQFVWYHVFAATVAKLWPLVSLSAARSQLLSRPDLGWVVFALVSVHPVQDIYCALLDKGAVVMSTR